MLIQKQAPATTVIDVQNAAEVVIVMEDNKITLTEDEIVDLFQDTSSENELGNE